MAFTDEQLNKIRNEEFDEKLFFLLRLADSDNNTLARVNNTEEDVTLTNGTTYKTFPFIIGLQNISEERADDIILKFPNSEEGGVSLYSIIDNVSRLTYSVVSAMDTSVDIYPKITFLIKSYSQKLGYTEANLHIAGVYDKKFPFEVFNSEQHPGLYT